MSLALPHPFRKRSTYLLQAEDLLALGSKRVNIRHFYSALTKRAVALLFVFVLAFSGAAGLFFSSVAAAPKASATIIDDWMCNGRGVNDNNNSDGNSSNATYQSLGWSGLWNQSSAQSPSMLAVQTYAGDKTAYEVFTPFMPMFDSWSGLYVNDNNAHQGMYQPTSGAAAAPITGIDSKGATTTDVRQSPVFSHSGTDCQVLDSFRFATSSIANIIFFLPKTLVYLGAESYGWALDNEYITQAPDKNGQGGSALHPLLTGVNALILGTNGNPGLKDQLYLPFLIPIIAMSALYFFYIGIIKRSTTGAISAFVWMLASIVAGVMFLTNPTWIPSWSDGLVKTVQTAVIGALDADPGVADMCHLPTTSTTSGSGTGSAAGQSKTTTNPDVTSRELKCAIWYTNIYVPWVSGQFNTSPSAKYAHDYAYAAGTGLDAKGNIVNQGQHYNALTYDPQGVLSGHKPSSIKILGTQIINGGVLQLGGKGVQATWGTYEMANQLASVVSQTSYASDIAYAQLGTAKHINYTWTGTGMQQIGLAILALISSIGTLVLVISSAFMLIAYEISTVFLVVLSPFFFLMGAVPGFGKRIMLRWFELMASLTVKRILVTFLVAIFLRLYSLVMDPNTGLTWMLQVIVVTILAFVGVSQRGKLVNMFAEGISFGGDKRFSDGSEQVANIGRQGARFGQRVGAGTVNAGIAKLGQMAGYNSSGESNEDFAEKSGVLVKGKDAPPTVNQSRRVPPVAPTTGGAAPKPITAPSTGGPIPKPEPAPIPPLPNDSENRVPKSLEGTLGGNGTTEDPWILSDADAEAADMPYDDGTRPSDRTRPLDTQDGSATDELDIPRGEDGQIDWSKKWFQEPTGDEIVPTPIVRPSMAQRVDEAKNAHKREFDVAAADKKAKKRSSRFAMAEGFMSGFSSGKIQPYGSFTTGLRLGNDADKEVQQAITAQASNERAIADQNLKGLELEQNEEVEAGNAARAAMEEQLRRQELEAVQAMEANQAALKQQELELAKQADANAERRNQELIDAQKEATDATSRAARANVEAAKLNDQAAQDRHEEMLQATRDAARAAEQHTEAVTDAAKNIITEAQRTRGTTRDALKEIRRTADELRQRRDAPQGGNANPRNPRGTIGGNNGSGRSFPKLPEK